MDRYHKAMTLTPVGSQLVGAGVLAKLFRGLGEPTRLALLLHLLAGERCVSDLVAAVGGSQSNVSGHLACLKDCGIVVDRPGERRQVLYRIAQPELFDVLAGAERLLEATGSSVEFCVNYRRPSPESADVAQDSR